MLRDCREAGGKTRGAHRHSQVLARHPQETCSRGQRGVWILETAKVETTALANGLAGARDAAGEGAGEEEEARTLALEA